MERSLHYLEIIKDAIEAVLSYISDSDRDEFLRNNQMKDACLMRLIVIGEYGSKVSTAVKEQFTEIEWQQIKAARNFYIHVYDGVNWAHVWETIHEDLPRLKPKIERLIYELEKDNNATN